MSGCWCGADDGGLHRSESGAGRDDANPDPGDAPQLTEADALLCRMRAMIDGMALGTGPLVENIFGWCRGLFGEKRTSGARKLRNIDTPLRTLRDLRMDPPP